ncbi:MAG: DUF3592 domain-containing protein [Burkholderiales bacterium]
MDDTIIIQSLLTFWGAVFAGLAIGGLVGWLKNFNWGIACGCLIIGAGGLAGAAWLGWHQYQLIAGTQQAQGVLLEFVTVASTDGKGRSTSSRAPVVRFKAADGRTYRVQGLGGSQGQHEPGDAVPIRYRPDDPQQAVIDDFQNQWGGVWALALFGLFPTMFGSYFLGLQLRETREQQPTTGRSRTPPPARTFRLSPEQRAWRLQKLTIVANIVFLSGFLVAMFAPLELLKALGLAFSVIGSGCLLHCVAQGYAPVPDWSSRGIFLIVGLGFLLFGFGGWMMG